MKTILLLAGWITGVISLQAQSNTFPATGNVGIGTLSPTHFLHVTNGIKANSLYIGSSSNFSDRTGSGDNIYIRQPIQTSGGWWGIHVSLQGTVANHTASFYPIRYMSDENEDGAEETVWYYVDKNGSAFYAGNVGIGTKSPSEKLSVNGNISSKKSIVTQVGWSDYVFNDNYILRPIREVDGYIKEHRHLPEVPSAKEVEEKGVDLGANQALLLKKIEELTLYIIKQDKQIEEITEKLKKLIQEKERSLQPL